VKGHYNVTYRSVIQRPSETGVSGRASSTEASDCERREGKRGINRVERKGKEDWRSK